MGDVEDRLEVKVIAAEGLLEVDGGECNPFSEIKCGNKFERTIAKSGTQNPVWNTSTMIFTGLTEANIDHLLVTVKHNTRYSSKSDMPLGQAAISLRTVMLSPGIVSDDWYDLRSTTTQVGEAATGRIRVEVAYFMHDDEMLFGEEEDYSDDEEGGEGGEGRMPNMLFGTIHRGRSLNLSGRTAIDSYVTIRAGGGKISTAVVRRTNAPRWDHKFQLPVKDGTAKITLKVKNSGVLSKQLIGSATLPIVEVAACGDAGLMKWQRLYGEDGAVDGEDRGEIELQLVWKYSHKYARSLNRIFSSSMATMSDAVSHRRKQEATPVEDEAQRLLAAQDDDKAWMMEQEQLLSVKLSAKEQEDLDEQRLARRMMADRILSDLTTPGEYDMVPGDYQIQIHLIECRELASEDLNGLSDPYVRVKVLGRSKKTKVVRKNLSPVFDEVLYFNLKNLTKSQVEEAVVEVQIFDYDALQRHELIGLANFDVRSVHALPDHEFYRKWVGVVDTENVSDSGYQGYLKTSVTVLGPGDSQKAHDLDKEYQAELQAELDSGGGAGGMTLTSGSLLDDQDPSKLVFLRVYVWEAQDLPTMNNGVFSSGGSIEAYAKVEFAGSHAQTSSINCRGRQLAPIFNEEIWIPIFEPTQAKRIKLGLWDYNTMSRDKAVAHAYFDYADVKRVDGENAAGNSYFGSTMAALGGGKYGGPRPRWHNLYGAPLGIQGKRGALQNRYGDEATTYRGRILVSMEVVTQPSSKRKQIAQLEPFSFRPSEGLKPATVKYHLRVLAIMGSEIPTFSTAVGLGTTTMGLVVSIGNHVIEFDFKPNKRGVVEWGQLESLKSIDLPVMLEEIPDVCVYLVRGPPKVMRVCYTRIPAAQLLKEQFLGEPEWVNLKADKVRTRAMGGVALTANPGAILFKLGLGLSDDALDPAFAWKEHELMKKVSEKRPFCLRVLVYQARNLPSSDENGLLDPYVKVRFCGKKEKTSVRTMTTAPLWYETLQFMHETLPKDPRFGPDIVMQVWDQDQLSSNSPVAMLRMPLRECAVLAASGEAGARPGPTWRRLSDLNGEELGAELLVTAMLIRKRDLKEKLSRPDPIVPAARPAWIEITCVGVRQLKSYHLRQPREPYVRFDVQASGGMDDEGGAGGTAKTAPSKKPSGRNANFLERKIIALEIAESPLFAPRLEMRVYDSSVGLTTGLQQTLLGACSIDLASKMVWNAEGYVPPQMELFNDAERLERQRLEQQAFALKAKTEAEDEADKVDDDDDDEEKKREGNVGFGDMFDDEEEEADEEVEQHELERNTLVNGVDAGTGAFEPSALADLPMVYEDVLYEEEQALLAESLKRKEEQREETSGHSWVDMVEARLKNATDISLENEDYKLSELDISFPNQWAVSNFIKGRDWWVEKQGTELENYLKTKPFETYPIYRGRYHPDPAKSTLRVVGWFKGVIRVLETDPVYEEDEFLPMNLLKPAAVFSVRLYVIKAANLQPVDGRSADPYLRIKLGNTVEERPKSHRAKTLKPDFYETFEFKTTLPGPSTLKIQVKDWNRFYPIHELIGETKIDLEDRWFHEGWQALDELDEYTNSANNDGLAKRRQQEQSLDPGGAEVALGPKSKNKLKPIEVRSLHREDDATAQGQLHLWLEIRREQEVRKEPPVPLEGPEKRKFEVRVIVWKSLNVPYEMGDFYVEAWLGDLRHQKTDVHWRCRNGKASWNYRIKFQVELPLAVPELGRLNLQLWDQDVLKWNDVIGETHIDLYRWFLKAYHEQRSVNVFKMINDAVTRKKNEEQGIANDSDLETDSSSDDEDGSDDDDGSVSSDRKNDDEETKEEEVSNPLNDDSERPLLLTEDKKKKQKEKKKEEEEGEGDEIAAAKKAEAEQAQAEADFFVRQLKDMVGLGEIDESAQWLAIDYMDRKKKKLKHRGKIAVSIEIMPLDEAELRPAGHGRSEPNTNPVLPPTTGRMQFTYNPFAICTTLLGPKLAFQIVCCFCCVILMVVLGVVGMYFTSFYNLLQSMGLAR